MGSPSSFISYRQAILEVIRLRITGNPYLDILYQLAVGEEAEAGVGLSAKYKEVMGKDIPPQTSWLTALAEMFPTAGSDFYFSMLLTNFDKEAGGPEEVDNLLTKKCLLVYSKANGKTAKDKRASFGSYATDSNGLLKGAVIFDGVVEIVQIQLPTWEQEKGEEFPSSDTKPKGIAGYLGRKRS